MKCASCGHEGPEAEFIRELKLNWEWTGGYVCRNPDECFARWVTL